MKNDFQGYELIKEYRVYIEERKLWLKARIILDFQDGRYEAQVSHRCIPIGGGDYHSVNSIHDFSIEKVEYKLFSIFLPEFKQSESIDMVENYDDWCLPPNQLTYFPND